MILEEQKCGCTMLDQADPVTLSTIAECEEHRVERERFNNNKGEK